MREFIENIHLERKDIITNSDKFRDYLRYKYQSKAFPLSLIFATSSVIYFFKRSKFNSRLVNNFYAINLFFASQIFTYEIISKHYTDKNKLAIIDTYSYTKEQNIHDK